MLWRHAKSVLKAIVSPLLDATGVYDRRIEEVSVREDRWTILMYHRVVIDDRADPFRLGMCVRRDRFEAQIRYLKSRFNLIGVGEAVRRLKEGRPLPSRAVSVTFDDGYLDNLEVALPVLESHQVPWTLFVPTGGLATGEPLWWDRVIHAFACTSRSSIDVQAIGLPRLRRRLSLAPWHRRRSVEQVLEALWSLPMAEIESAVLRLERALAPRVRLMPVAHRLRPADVRELHRRGVEIGAHTVMHPNLCLTDRDQLRDEMLDSRRELEALCGAPVEGFAYPGGRMNEAVKEAAHEAGFSYALATISAVNHLPCDAYELCRIGMPDSELPDFKRALSATMARGDGPTHSIA